MPAAKRPPRGAQDIAQVLGTAGYTDYAASCIKRYWRRNCVVTDLQKKRHAGIVRAFAESVLPTLTDAQKKVLGRYISMLNRAQFDTGLRIGLTTRMFDAEGQDEG